ncbi:MAG: Maf family nucleotide pyrophosphatase [Bacteroidetes bacterium]|nr:Maf family nucleotide pyrophosphatase [Bacteroidota bacterium]
MINFAKYDIILASQSPRRQQLLKDMGFDFRVIVTDAEEIYPAAMPLLQIPVYLAEVKANAITAELKENTLIIAADTIVAIEDKVLGKPRDEKDAFDILQQISGRMHQVITGVCLKAKEKQHSFYALSNVYFRHLSDEEINYYITKYKPFDKAGAYGVQEWIGYVGIEHIEGSYFNVMGLPTQMLYQELIHF